MALIFVDGFDFWTTVPGCWLSGGGTYPPTVSGSVLSVIGATPNVSGTSFLRWTFPGNKATVIVNGRCTFEAKSQDETIFQLCDGDTVQCSLMINGAGQLFVKRGSHSGTLVGTVSTLGLVQDLVTFYDIEWKVTCANSGACIIKVNGEEVLNVTGDLASSTTEASNNIILGRNIGSSPSNAKETKWEHILIMDTSGTEMNDFIGPIKVNPHALTADGFYTDFTANTGNRWDAVNDLDPDDAATFITSATVGHKYTAVADNLPAGITSVYALAVWIKSARSDDATRAYKALLRYSGSDQLGSADKYIGPDYDYRITTFDVSPFSAVAWTPTEIDGLEVGVQLTI